jgi:hypothetical protein
MTGIFHLHHGRKPLSLEDRVALLAAAGTEAINDRIAQLECEWPCGRMVKGTLGAAIVIGFALAAAHDPYWVLVPLTAGAFLVQYLFFPQSLLTDLFKAMGFRCGSTIDEERLMLRALRGDFKHLPTLHEVTDKNAVSRMEDDGGPAYDPDDGEYRYAPREAAAILVTATVVR